MKRPLVLHTLSALLLALAAAPAPAQTSLAPAAPMVAKPAEPTAVEQVQQLARSGQSAKALALADSSLAANPKNAQMRFVRAVLLADLGRATEAKAGFEQLTQDYPELPEPYNNLATLLAGEGQLARAEQLLKSAIEASPGFATAHENLGDLYLRLASDAYAQASRLAPASRSAAAKLTAVRELTHRNTKR